MSSGITLYLPVVPLKLISRYACSVLCWRRLYTPAGPGKRGCLQDAVLGPAAHAAGEHTDFPGCICGSKHLPGIIKPQICSKILALYPRGDEIRSLARERTTIKGE